MRMSEARVSCTARQVSSTIGRGHALMDEARLGPDEFGEMGQKGDDVVLGDLLDRVDAGDVE